MVWNYSEKSELKMKQMDKKQITSYLDKIPTLRYKLMVFIKLRQKE